MKDFYYLKSLFLSEFAHKDTQRNKIVILVCIMISNKFYVK